MGCCGGAGTIRVTDSSGISSSSDQRTLAPRALAGFLLSPVKPTRSAEGRLRADRRVAVAVAMAVVAVVAPRVFLALGLLLRNRGDIQVRSCVAPASLLPLSLSSRLATLVSSFDVGGDRAISLLPRGHILRSSFVSSP